MRGKIGITPCNGLDRAVSIIIRGSCKIYLLRPEATVDIRPTPEIYALMVGAEYMPAIYIQFDC